MKIIILVAFLCNFLFLSAFGQGSYNVYGKIFDAETGEFIIGANIYSPTAHNGISSNTYGFYSLKLDAGKQKIIFSHLGFDPIEKEIALNNNLELNIYLNPKSQNIDEIVVTANNNKTKSDKTGFHKLTLTQIKNTPSVAGINDILKTIQLLPGVISSNEGTVGFNVRGGSFDQNLILIDEAPLYNPSHALGFFSTINTSLIKDVSLFKGDFNARYGGRASSVLDIRLREGNNKEYNIQGELGILSSGLIIEGPLKKEKCSFIIGGRYSYAGWIANNLYKINNTLNLSSLNNFKSGNDVYFYDINAKLNYSFNEKNKLFLSAYNGLDYFYSSNIDDRTNLTWGNSAATFRWNHIANAKLIFNTSIIYSKYKYQNNFEGINNSKKWDAEIQNFNIKSDFDYYLSSNHYLTYGLGVDYFIISPGNLTSVDTLYYNTVQSLPVKKCILPSMYLSDKWDFSNSFSIQLGVRFSLFGLFGNGYGYTFNNDGNIQDSAFYNSDKFEKYYLFIEPRLIARYSFTENTSLKGGYTRTSQSIHQIGNTSVSLPTDIWIPVDGNISPLISNNYTIGFYHYFKNLHNINFSLEAYYKDMNHVVDFIDNADLLMNKHIATQIKSGDATAYGIELLIERNNKKFTGWLSYTYSYIEYKIDGINAGNTYFPRHNKPHNLSVFLNYNINKQLSINAIFKYTSGGYITIPEGTFFYNGATFNYFTERNSYELPPYHRMDIGLNYIPKRNDARKWKSQWNIGIYNIYGRKNTFSLYTQASLESISVYKMYVFGLTPYLSYTFKF